MRYALIIVSFLLLSCVRTPRKIPHETTNITTLSPASYFKLIQDLNDTSYLLLIKYLPFELPKSSVNEQFPNWHYISTEIDTIRLETHSHYSVDLEIWKKPALLTLYFKNDTLSLYTVVFCKPQEQKQLFKRICDLYERNFGGYTITREYEDRSYSDCAHWNNNVYFNLSVGNEPMINHSIYITYAPAYKR